MCMMLDDHAVCGLLIVPGAISLPVKKTHHVRYLMLMNEKYTLHPSLFDKPRWYGNSQFHTVAINIFIYIHIYRADVNVKRLIRLLDIKLLYNNYYTYIDKKKKKKIGVEYIIIPYFRP